MKNSRPWRGFTEHWSLLLVGVFIFIAFSGLLAKNLNRNTQLENINILLPSSSTDFVLRPLNRDSLGISASSSFELKSPIELHKEQIYANLKFEPANNYKAIKLPNSWKITFDQPFQPNQLVKATLVSYAGTISTTTVQKFAWSYQVKTPPSITSTLPADQATEVPLDSRIVIRLSHDNFFDADKYLAINPAIKGAVSHVGRNLIFTPSEPLRPGTIYSVSIKKELPLADTYDRIAADYRFAFETAATGIEQTHDFSIDSGLRQFHSDAAPAFDLKANREPLELAATLYAYDSADDYIKDLSDNALPWWSKNKTLSSLDFLNGKEVFKFHQLTASGILQFPVQLSPGFYLAKFSSAATTNYAWFQVTDLSAFESLDHDKLLVWVNDSDGPAASADVQVFGSDDSYQSNSKGIALFETPKAIQSMLDTPSSRHQLYLKISQGNKQAVLPLFDFTSYKFSEEKNSADKYAYAWNFDRSSYKPGEPVIFRGSVHPRLNEAISDLSFEVRSAKNFLDYLDIPKPLYSSSTESDNGRFQIALPESSYLPGDYALAVSVNGEYLDRAYFHISNCTETIPSTTPPNDYQEPFHYYAINEPIKTIFTNSTNTPSTTKTNNYLYIKYRNGFKWYDVSNSPAYETLFTPDLVPNFYLSSIRYDNGYYLAEPRLFLSELSTGTKSFLRPLTPGVWSQTATDLRLIPAASSDNLDALEPPSLVVNNNCQEALPAKISKLGTSSKITVYQLPDGGLSLNFNGPSNLELSSLIALTSDTRGLSHASLYDYLLNRLESANAKNEEMTLAMSGLAGLDNPLLTRLNSWTSYRHDLSGKEKVFIALALQKLGAQEWKKQLISSVDYTKLSAAEKNILEQAR
jgi:hypothetical protein